MKKLIKRLFQKRSFSRDLSAQSQLVQSKFRCTQPVPKFKNEIEMKTYFAKNLGAIEPGLRLYKRGRWTGIEVPCAFTEWGRPGVIDILAEDESGAIVIIECKNDFGKSMSFGQVLGYLAWMKAWLDVRRRQGHMAKVPAVRAYIVALRASSMLRFLMMAYPEYDITLFETEPILTVDPGANMAYRPTA